MGAILSFCCYTEPEEERIARLHREHYYNEAMSGRSLAREHSFEPWQNPDAWPPPTPKCLRRKPIAEDGYGGRVFDTPKTVGLPAVVGAHGKKEEGMYTGEIHRGIRYLEVDLRGSAQEVPLILWDPIVHN